MFCFELIFIKPTYLNFVNSLTDVLLVSVNFKLQLRLLQHHAYENINNIIDFNVKL